MNINDIFDQVESPFNDEGIIELIKKYIGCSFNLKELYKSTNKMEIEEHENPYLKELDKKVYADPFETERGGRFYKQNDYWTIVGSSKDALDVPDKRDERVPIYRIYINAKGKDKAKTVEEYLQRCKEAGQQYKLKYANEDGRDDEIVILSYGEDLVRNIEFLAEITDGMNLGEPPELVGKYKDKIGIGEEFIFAPIYSYTETRLGIISSCLTKFYLDHLEDFSRYIDERLKKNHEFKRRMIQKEAPERLSNYLGYMRHELSTGKPLLYKPEIMSEYISEHFETAIPELLENYHSLCNVYEISENGVFSTRTAEMLEQQKTTPLQQREAQLSSLEAEERTISEAEALIDKQSAKEGQSIGEE